MVFSAKKQRNRCNSDLLQLTFKSKHAFLLENEFESTKLKLDLLHRFERSFLSETENSNKQMLEEIVMQNRFLSEIKEAISQKTNLADDFANR